MTDFPPENSVGLVSPQVHHFDEPLVLRSGKRLDNYHLIYELGNSTRATMPF